MKNSIPMVGPVRDGLHLIADHGSCLSIRKQFVTYQLPVNLPGTRD
jgi:hypothetical protein